MTRLEWNAPGTREYEAGVSHGVLFVGEEEGVPWNGLKSVSVEAKNGEIKPYYMDGHLYYNQPGRVEINGSISAFTSPVEFDECEGTLESSLGSGLFLSQQRRKEFHFSWRTGIGNDLDGLDRGYKLHLLYNGLASPSSPAWSTVSDQTEPTELSWSYVTRPVAVPTGFRPTAHIAVNSTRVAPGFMHYLEAILYGTRDTAGRVMSIAEIIAAMKVWGPAWQLREALTTGLSDISVAGIPDLMGDTQRGLFTRPVGSRLYADETPGFYKLEQ